MQLEAERFQSDDLMPELVPGLTGGEVPAVVRFVPSSTDSRRGPAAADASGRHDRILFAARSARRCGLSHCWPVMCMVMRRVRGIKVTGWGLRTAVAKEGSEVHTREISASHSRTLVVGRTVGSL